MRVNQPQPAKTIPAAAVRAEVGQEHAAHVADNRNPHSAAPIQKRTDLALNIVGDFGEIAGQFGRDHRAAAALPVGEPLQQLKLGGLETRGIACETYGRTPRTGLNPFTGWPD